MIKWLKRIGLFAGFLIALEVVAYVGLTLLGPNAFRQVRTVLNPFGDPTPAVATNLEGGGEQRCATYQGEIYCITEGGSAMPGQDTEEVVPDTENPGGKRCATFEGETICIEGDY